MTLPTTGNLSLSQVRAEFGAPASTPLSAFVRGGAWVPNTAANSGVPAALPISLRQLLGASAIIPHTVTANGISELLNTASPQTVSGTSTATVSDGIGPFAHAWTIVTGTNFTLGAGADTATVTASRDGALGFGTSAGTIRDTVTDLGNGNHVATVEVSVSLASESNQ